METSPEAALPPRSPDPHGAGQRPLGGLLRRALPAFALLAVLGAAHAPALGGGFVWDDVILIRDAPAVHGLGTAWQAAFGDFFGQAAGQPPGGYLRPLPLLLNAVTWAVAGPSPLAFRLTNLLLHFACALTVASLVGRLLPGPRSRRVAWAAAFLFALHPVQVEAVDFISARTDLLATLFGLLTLRALLARPGASGVIGGRLRPVGLRAIAGGRLRAIACFALALASKETALALPFAAWPLLVAAGDAPRVALRRLLPLAALVLLALGARAALGIAPVERQYFPADGLPVAALTLLGHYAARVVLPGPGMALYDDLPVGAFGGYAVAGLVVGVGAAVLAVRASLRRAWDLPTAGFLVALATLAPALHVVPLPVLAADRFLYLPLAGLTLGLAALVSDALRSSGSDLASGLPAYGRSLSPSRVRLAGVAAAALAVVFVGTTAVRAADWASERALWTAERVANPKSFKAALNLGIACAEAGAPDEARDALRLAWTLRPGDARVWRNLVALGALETRSGAAPLPAGFGEAARQRPPDPDRLRAFVPALRAGGRDWLAAVIESWPSLDSPGASP